MTQMLPKTISQQHSQSLKNLERSRSPNPRNPKTTISPISWTRQHCITLTPKKNYKIKRRYDFILLKLKIKLIKERKNILVIPKYLKNVVMIDMNDKLNLQGNVVSQPKTTP